MWFLSAFSFAAIADFVFALTFGPNGADPGGADAGDAEPGDERDDLDDEDDALDEPRWIRISVVGERWTGIDLEV